MSRAGKKNPHKKQITREATNLTIDIELKTWAANYVDAHHGGSLSELVNALLGREKAAQASGTEAASQSGSERTQNPEALAQHRLQERMRKNSTETAASGKRSKAS